MATSNSNPSRGVGTASVVNAAGNNTPTLRLSATINTSEHFDWESPESFGELGEQIRTLLLRGARTMSLEFGVSDTSLNLTRALNRLEFEDTSIAPSSAGASAALAQALGAVFQDKNNEVTLRIGTDMGLDEQAAKDQFAGRSAALTGMLELAGVNVTKLKIVPSGDA